jgi:histidyl-tRNA synthetase
MSISLEPYKGVRDFYPEERFVRNYIFYTWQKAVESFGYERYDASVLEPLDLYKAKTSEEIVNNEIYSFIDRGEREVALRPEMTPTVARMVAAKAQELPVPIRWYSIPNVFRYEKPQRGRLREHWQLNVDLFGANGISADEHFEIRINSRKLLEDAYVAFGVAEDKKQAVSRIIDKKEKISADSFREALREIMGEAGDEFAALLDNTEGFFEKFGEAESAKELKQVIDSLWQKGVKNVVFSPTLTRGFDYYTGMVFEIFDTNPENSRSIFGGGRYDKLVGQLSGREMSAIGFGLGDVTMQDFLATHNLLPQYVSATQLWIAIAPDTDMNEVEKLATELREKGLNVGIDISGKKLPDQLKSLDKRKIPYVIIVGPEELKSGKFKVRNAATREEKEVSLSEIPEVCVK